MFDIVLMYIYISPKNFVKGNVQLLKDCSLGDLGNDTCQVLFGMILNDSEPARFITAKTAEAKC